MGDLIASFGRRQSKGSLRNVVQSTYEGKGVTGGSEVALMSKALQEFQSYWNFGETRS